MYIDGTKTKMGFFVQKHFENFFPGMRIKVAVLVIDTQAVWYSEDAEVSSCFPDLEDNAAGALHVSRATHSVM
jgi:hypothetical protein